MQVITVKYLGPTNYKGTRWTVRNYNFRKMFDRDFELNHDADAKRVAEEFCNSINTKWLEGRKLIGSTDFRGDWQFLLVEKE